MSALPIARADAPPLRPPVEDARGVRVGIAPDELADLVRSFTEVTERLQATHVALESRVGRLQAELADANERLRRSRELAALGEMAAGIAHEIRNPLGSIALDVERLREDLLERPELAGVCGRILGCVARLDRIVGDVLRFARDVVVRPGAIDVAEPIDAALMACGPLARDLGVLVERGAVVEGSLVADGHLLTQAIVNLLRNAIEATAEGRTPHAAVRIEAKRVRRVATDGKRRDHVAFRVDDSGPGVSDELRERIFRPFFTTRAEGTGLGLAIVHRIAEAHGGTVSVRNLERGARFELLLPIAASAAAGPITNSAAKGDASLDGVAAAIRRRVGRVPDAAEPPDATARLRGPLE